MPANLTPQYKEAEKKAREILNSHYPVYIDEKIDKKVRDNFPIEIPLDVIKPTKDRF